jgi:hypothetical protein
MNIECATLTLKTADLPTTGDNVYGTSNTLSTFWTWKNINLQTILGDMYHEYETFNIVLASVSAGIGGAVGTTTQNDRNVLIKMSGLPFKNQTFDATKQHNTNAVALTTMYMGDGSNIFNQYLSNGHYITFTKTATNVDLTITYEPINNTTSVGFINSWAFPELVLIFKIYGCKKVNPDRQEFFNPAFKH